MALRFFNTMKGKKEIFRPLRPGVVTMYNCGPTVYDHAHLGNFRTYMFADVLRRYLEWKGFRVRQVMNITDVGHMTVDDVADGAGEDKIEKKAREERKSPRDIAGFYTRAFLEDWKKLNLKEPEARPKATDYIGQMVGTIGKLMDRGHAYEAGGSVYFHVPSFPGYGKLSGNTIEQLRAGAGGRVEHNPDKRNQLDFALWVRNPKHLMQWDSPWGRGYPGWHIECSVMSMELLGETIDIHTGGEDNIFPHHDSEIAQSEAASGRPFVRFWMHSRHMMVEGKKMSKRLGNFYCLDDVLGRGFSPEAVRYALLSSHYRARFNLTEKGLRAAEENANTLKRFMANLRDVRGKGRKDLGKIIDRALKGFEREMDDDLNMPGALAHVFALVREANRLVDKKEVGEKGAARLMKAMNRLDEVLGLGLGEVGQVWHAPEEAPRKIRELILKREEYRKDRKWKEADRIRSELKKKGYILEDTPEGVRWKLLEQ
jgi:cysteinyl-tRNA synthetase